MKMAAELVAESVRLFASSEESERSQAIKKIASGISGINKDEIRISILDVVEHLGPYLTDSLLEKRRCGTQILAELLFRIQPVSLSLEEADVLVSFFCDRLKDHHSIQPIVIYGLLGIVSYQKVSPKAVSSLCQTLFQEVHVQSLIQADRKNAYNLLANLLNNFKNDLNSFGQDFVLGFIQAIDGEKDPRNLCVCFNMVASIIDCLPFDNFREDLFEVVACYFPIDFHPPPDDKFQVTHEELVLGLRRCLSRTAKFSEYALPLLLDKLSSDINEVKVDSLMTLIECLKVYSEEDLKMFATDIWSSIRRDLLLSGLADLEKYCQDVLTQMVACFEKGLWNETGVEFINLLIRDGLPLLGDAERQHYVPVLRLLIAAVKHSAFAYRTVLTSVFPVLCQHTLGSENGISTRSAGLCGLNEFLEIAITLENPNIAASCIESLQLVCDHLPSFMTNLRYKEMLPSCIKFLTYICLMLPDKGKNLLELVDNLWTMLCTHEEDLVWTQCIKSLCKLFPLLDKGSVASRLAKLKAVILEMLLSESSYVCNMSYMHLMCLSCDLCRENPAFCADFIGMVCNCIQEAGSKVARNDALGHLFSYISVMMGIQLEAPSCDFSWTCSKISTLVVTCWHSDIASLRVLLKNYYSLLVRCRPDQQLTAFSDIAASFKDFNLESCDASEYVKLTTVAKYVIPPLHVSVINASRLLSMMPRYTTIAIKSSCDVTAANASQVVASIINKLEGDDLHPFLDEVKTILQDMTMSPRQDASIRSQCLYVLWFAKGLLLRWHDDTVVIISQLIELLSSNIYGLPLSENFGILLHEYDDILNESCHARLRFLYKQRFLREIMPMLVKSYNCASDCKEIYLKAISNLLQVLPTEILKDEVKNLLPLLMQALQSDDNAVILYTLEALLSVEAEDGIFFTEHLVSLVDKYLTLAKDSPAMKVRIASVKCLERLSHLPSHVVVPVKRKVITRLGKVLDDKKRLVRKETVQCRNVWCLL